MKIKKKIIIYAFSMMLQTSMAIAYIDPGTGGVIAGSIWPFIVGIFGFVGAFFVKYFYKPLKRGVLTAWRKLGKREQ